VWSRRRIIPTYAKTFKRGLKKRPRIHFEGNHRFTGITLKLRRYNDTTTIQAKLRDKLDTFQTIHFMRCFKQQHGFAV
jgi:hypothetical protein